MTGWYTDATCFAMILFLMHQIYNSAIAMHTQ